MSKKKKTTKSATPAASAPTPAPAAPVITSLDDTKLVAEVEYQTLVNGLPIVFAGVDSFDLPSGTITMADLLTRFQQRIAAAEKTKAARATWRGDVASEHAVAAETDPLREEVRQMAIGRLGKTSEKLKMLGFTPAKVRKVPVATKAAAQAKAKVTREERNTMGKKQRAAADAKLAASVPPAPPSKTGNGSST